ncbi:MAG: hypothetical protein H0X25_16640 [Acidobacteriales bacterium]|nr:hypothetical protein [Terriglobales bacterium]
MPEQSNSSNNSADIQGVDARALAYIKAGPKLSLISGRWVPAQSGEMKLICSRRYTNEVFGSAMHL